MWIKYNLKYIFHYGTFFFVAFMQRNSQLSSNAEPVCMSDSLPRLYLSWIQSQHLGVNPITAQYIYIYIYIYIERERELV